MKKKLLTFSGIICLVSGYFTYGYFGALYLYHNEQYYKVKEHCKRLPYIEKITSEVRVQAALDEFLSSDYPISQSILKNEHHISLLGNSFPEYIFELDEKLSKTTKLSQRILYHDNHYILTQYSQDEKSMMNTYDKLKKRVARYEIHNTHVLEEYIALMGSFMCYAKFRSENKQDILKQEDIIDDYIQLYNVISKKAILPSKNFLDSQHVLLEYLLKYSKERKMDILYEKRLNTLYESNKEKIKEYNKFMDCF